MIRTVAVMLSFALLTNACAGGPPRPFAIAIGQEPCAYCRMVVSNARFSAELLSRHEEPKFFDDVGCLASFLKQHAVQPDAVAYVTDHRTGEWIMASRASYTRMGSLDTPMGSHVIAHRDAASRESDRKAGGGTPVSVAELFGATKPPEGSR